MTEIELRQGTVAIARTYLGIHELGTEHRDLIDYYTAHMRPGDYLMQYNDPWCASFTSVVGMIAVEKYDLSCKPYELIPSSAACDAKIAEYKRLGRWVEDDAYLPTPGDEIFYDWQDSGSGDNQGSSDHVGLVTDVDATGITVVEGNTSDMVAYRTIPCDARYIRGYGVPDYGRWAATSGVQQDGEAATARDDGESMTIPAPGKNVRSKITGLPTLHKGDGIDDPSEIVRAAQILLIGRGVSCGKCGADGEFGTDTLSAVLTYQRRKRIEPDGIIGPDTWAALLGL